MKKSAKKITMYSMILSIIASLISFVLMSVYITFINVTRDKYGLISDTDFKWRLQGIAGVFMLVSFIFAIIAILVIRSQKVIEKNKKPEKEESVEERFKEDLDV